MTRDEYLESVRQKLRHSVRNDLSDTDKLSQQYDIIHFKNEDHKEKVQAANTDTEKYLWVNQQSDLYDREPFESKAEAEAAFMIEYGDRLAALNEKEAAREKFMESLSEPERQAYDERLAARMALFEMNNEKEMAAGNAQFESQAERDARYGDVYDQAKSSDNPDIDAAVVDMLNNDITKAEFKEALGADSYEPVPIEKCRSYTGVFEAVQDKEPNAITDDRNGDGFERDSKRAAETEQVMLARIEEQSSESELESQ